MKALKEYTFKVVYNDTTYIKSFVEHSKLAAKLLWFKWLHKNFEGLIN